MLTLNFLFPPMKKSQLRAKVKRNLSMCLMTVSNHSEIFIFFFQTSKEQQITNTEEASQDTIQSIDDASENSKSSSDMSKVKIEKVKVEKKPDLTSPIEVTDHMEVMVKGKKCLLKVNPDTGQLCAYPLILPGEYSTYVVWY